VKPQCQFSNRRLPRTDCFFQTDAGRWHYWPGGDDQPRRYNLGREYLVEAARERAKEMAVFAIIMIIAAWPVIYMVITVVQLLHKGRTLDR